MQHNPDSGGQSEVVGVILILTLVMLAISVILVTGYPTVDRMQENAETERMVNEMGVLDAEIGAVALGGAGSRTVNMNTGGGSLTVDEDRGNMVVEHDPIEGGPNDGDPYEIFNDTLGTVEYENNDRLLAYQGGGVWNSRVMEEGASMLAPPEFRFRGTTLTLPVVRIEGDRTLSGPARGDGLRVNQQSMERVFPDESEGWSNPIDNGSIYVTVQSRYYHGWANYFRERTDGANVWTWEGNQTARVQLDIEAAENIDSAMLTGGDGNTLLFGNNAHVGAYNSSDGYPYATECALEEHADSSCGHTSSDFFIDDGRIEGAGDVVLENNAKIWGDVFSEMEIVAKQPQNNRIHGNATAGDDIRADHPQYEPDDFITGPIIDPGADVDVGTPFPATPIVNHEIESASSADAAGETNEDCVDGENDLVNEDCTIEPQGAEDVYVYLTGGQVLEHELTIDLSDLTDDSDLRIAVDDEIVLEQHSKIDIINAQGDSGVRWAIQGDFTVENHADVFTEDRESFRNLVIIDRGTIGFRGGSDPPVFTGILYAPDSTMEEIRNTRAVYGALVLDNADQTPMNNLDFYYDQQLRGMEITLLEPGQAITYAHISENRVSIE